MTPNYSVLYVQEVGNKVIHEMGQNFLDLQYSTFGNENNNKNLGFFILHSSNIVTAGSCVSKAGINQPLSDINSVYRVSIFTMHNFYTEFPKIYRISVLHLIKYRFAVYLSR